MKLLKFKAVWCSPCRTLSTILDEFDMCPIENVDIDLNTELTQKYNIRGVPTLVLVDDSGSELWRNTGIVTKETVETEVKKYL